MRRHTLTGMPVLACAILLALPSPADAQLGRVRDAAQRAVEGEAANQIQRLLREAIRCAVNDPSCVEKAEADGKEVIYVDEDGEVITDEDGVPIQDRDQAAAASGSMEAPGEGIWTNYDFVPGDRVLFFEDYQNERVGDFPRRLGFVEGNWDIVEQGATRYMRSTSRGQITIPLPEALPDRFTIEFKASVGHGNGTLHLTPGPAFTGPDRSYEGSAVAIHFKQAGLRRVGGEGPEAMSLHELDFRGGDIASVRISAEGDYLKVYLNEKRQANVPTAVFPRTDVLYVSTSSANEQWPVLVGPVRIAEGGRDLYEALMDDGRVATQGILFAVNSDRIRPESTPTLTEIGRMMEEHPELRISIEGHTDSDGDEAHNQDLSERRAASVAQYLQDQHGIDSSRLETAGHGESMPVADNATPEGKQQNRRVELVRL